VSLGSWSHGWTSMRPWPLRSTSRGDPPSFFLNRLVATVERPGWCLIRCSVQQSLPQMIPWHLFLNLIIFFLGGTCWNFIFLNSQVEVRIIGALELELDADSAINAKTTRQALVDFALMEAPSKKGCDLFLWGLMNCCRLTWLVLFFNTMSFLR